MGKFTYGGQKKFYKFSFKKGLGLRRWESLHRDRFKGIDIILVPDSSVITLTNDFMLSLSI